MASLKAKEMKGSMRDSSTLNFGIQTALGNRDKTSLLILQIGKCIVIEGSHSYKVHIFRSANKYSPELYQLKYNCEQIRMLPNSVAIPHLSGWQDKVREQIEYLS